MRPPAIGFCKHQRDYGTAFMVRTSVSIVRWRKYTMRIINRLVRTHWCKEHRKYSSWLIHVSVNSLLSTNIVMYRIINLYQAFRFDVWLKRMNDTLFLQDVRWHYFTKLSNVVVHPILLGVYTEEKMMYQQHQSNWQQILLIYKKISLVLRAIKRLRISRCIKSYRNERRAIRAKCIS